MQLSIFHNNYCNMHIGQPTIEEKALLFIKALDLGLILHQLPIATHPIHKIQLNLQQPGNHLQLNVPLPGYLLLNILLHHLLLNVLLHHLLLNVLLPEGHHLLLNILLPKGHHLLLNVSGYIPHKFMAH